MLLVGLRRGIGTAETGVSENTAIGVGEAIQVIYCGFGDNLINVPKET